ncbi:MAG: peptide/nickel transport system substrate-binding protein, partial [Gammaproteobacteria bacterium]
MATQDELLKALHQNKISRRDFVRYMGALGVGAAAIPSLLTSPAMAAGTPKKGGKITLGVEAAQAKDSLDPTRYFSTANILMGFSVYDSLVNRGPDLKPIPWLAESWETGSDASEWIFKLRTDVLWHDGKPFTADDVMYSCARHTAENSESPAKGYMSQIAEMTKDGDHVVKFKLIAPNADFPIVLSDTRVQISQNGYEDFTNTTVGTGPFKVKEWIAGSRYVFERNDNYWGSDGPYVDELEVVAIGDITARVNALLSGDINVMLELDPKAVKLIERSSKVDLISSPSGAFVNLAMMLDREPTNNPDFRMAMKYAVDREQIVKNVFKGYGSVGNDHPISPTDPYFCADIAQREYDPDKARFHIKKAGLENTPIDLYGSDVPGAGSLAACQVLQQSASKAGININLINPPADTYWSAVWIQKPMVASGWDMRPVPDLMFSIAFKGDSDWNETKFADDRFDSLLLEARSTVDFDKRKEMYCEMQQIVQDDGGHVTLAFRDILDAKAKNVHGIGSHPSGPLGF